MEWKTFEVDCAGSEGFPRFQQKLLAISEFRFLSIQQAPVPRSPFVPRVNGHSNERASTMRVSVVQKVLTSVYMGDKVLTRGLFP
jgi:hypothetical protein